MTTKCAITFDNNPQGVYFGGQTLAGTVKLTTVKPKSIKAVYITIDGRAKVRWKKTSSRRSAGGKARFYTETYTAQEQYLSSRTYVVGDDRSTEQVLPIGIHIYTFKVVLPNKLPSTFIGRNGSIMYDVKLIIDRPWRFDNIIRQPFTVISPLDLNINPLYKRPKETAKRKEFWYGCFRGQRLIIKALIPFSGYAPGQEIPITVFVNNDSSIDCNGIKIKLNKMVQFVAEHPYSKTRYDVIKIFEKRLPGVLQKSRKEYTEYIRLPSIAPSTLETCSIIHVRYNIEVTGEISRFYRKVLLNLPITIGTVPVYESATTPSNVITRQPIGPVSGSGSESPPAYSSMILPTYEEATAAHVVPFEDDDDETKSHITDVSYTPKYPVYYNFSIPSVLPGSSSHCQENCQNPIAAATTLSNPASNGKTNTTTGYSATKYGRTD